ncbi:hypothetical protein VP01_3334g2 [Puccinia sorghi]|uniref:Uncharacterized protein n=1 Tax=Puccinia sorghi TaxID=27349 RepID=A0A0L6UX52_9BASI|nr:hypothetical protein VP01_3334g2 [Puccinia sorghi]
MNSSNGIIELLWHTTQFKHQTTKFHHPLNIEKKNPWTHFGATPEHLADATFCQQQRYGT